MDYGTNDEQKLIKTNDTNINCDINYKEIFNFLIRSKIISINNDAAYIKIKNIQILISYKIGLIR